MEPTQENNSGIELNPLDKVITQSVENVNGEIAEKVAKKRGRKPNSEKAPKSNISLLRNENIKSEELVKIEKSQYKLGIQMGFSMMGMYLSKAFKYDGFNLTQEELEAIGDSGSECAQHFMPAIHPKWVALGGFTMVMGGVYAMKVVGYNEFKKAQQPKKDDGVKKD